MCSYVGVIHIYRRNIYAFSLPHPPLRIARITLHGHSGHNRKHLHTYTHKHWFTFTDISSHNRFIPFLRSFSLDLLTGVNHSTTQQTNKQSTKCFVNFFKHHHKILPMKQKRVAHEQVDINRHSII